MVALVLRRLAIPGAYLAAAIFALHPVHVESVAWITEQKNTLSAVFYLGAMLVYLRFDQAWKTSLYWWALGLFALGLLSKTTTAALPAALLVIFWWQRGKLLARRDVLPLIPFFVLGLASGLFTAWVERKLVGAEGPEFALTLVQRGLIAGRVIWFYLGKLFWPGELIFFYPRWHVSQAVWWQYLFPLAAILLFLAFWRLRRRWRGPLAALLFFVGTLFPALGFCNVYPFLFSFVADHFQYLASLGVITLVSAAAVLLLARWGLWGRVVGYAMCLLLLATLGTLTWRQSRIYADLETLYRVTLDKNPTCWLVHYNLGVALADRQQIGDAIREFQRALAIRPDYFEAHNNLGAALVLQGRLDEAAPHYQKALEIRPDCEQAHCNLGNVLSSWGRLDEAAAHYQKALEIKSDYAFARYNFALVLARLGRLDEAIIQYRKALEINPNYAEAHNNLGDALVGKGRLDEAITHYQKALEIKPGNAQTHYNLGLALARRGQVDKAIAHYQKALEIKPDYVKAHSTLGDLLASQGNLDEAVRHYLVVLRSNPRDVRGHVQLGKVMACQGKPQAAEVYFREALHRKPSNAEACSGLAMALEQQGKIEEALRYYQESLQLGPKQPDILNNLAWIRATHPDPRFRDGAKAVEHALQANQLSGGRQPGLLDTLAAAYAEAGRFPEAIATARKALDLATRQNNRALADVLRARIALYDAGRPYHQTLPASAPPPKP